MATHRRKYNKTSIVIPKGLKGKARKKEYMKLYNALMYGRKIKEEEKPKRQPKKTSFALHSLIRMPVHRLITVVNRVARGEVFLTR